MLMFFDVETTGVPTRRGASFRETDVWPRIVSISWALHRPDGDLIHQRYAVVKPEGFTIPADSVRIHGITTEHARRHGRAVSDVIAEVNAELTYARPTLLVAHNIDFDKNVLLAEMCRAGADLVLERIPTYCTMQQGTDICRILGWGGRYKWPSLEELHRHLLKEMFEGAHDAASDVQACARCYFAMQQSQEWGHETTEESEADYAEELIARILLWAEDNDRFDPGFVLDLEKRLETDGRLTDGQLEALENIVTRWHVD